MDPAAATPPPPPPLRPSSSAGRISAVDVSQLDKINAIPNKTTNSVLLDGLCQEDRLYLDALMDEDSSDSDCADQTGGPASVGPSAAAWSAAMAGRPTMNNKRIRRLKPSYVTTMSLEDISYIRPSWGMSKGIARKLDRGGAKLRGVRANKSARARDQRSAGEQQEQQQAEAATAAAEPATTTTTAAQRKGASLLNAYNGSLVLLMLLLGALMLLSYYVDLARHRQRTLRLGIELDARKRTLTFLRFEQADQAPRVRRLRLHYARGMASNLRSDECTCQMYEAETRAHYARADYARPLAREAAREALAADADLAEPLKCFACLDWSMRANLQVLVNKSLEEPGRARDEPTRPASRASPAPLDEDLTVACYDVRWQSYDSLRTPLVDCLHLGEGDQWFGLGDTHPVPSVWPLSKFGPAAAQSTAASPLASNLTAEFGPSSWQQPETGGAGDGPALVMGSRVELELLSSSGFYLGNLRTDFQASVRVSAAAREICLSVSCADRCTQSWARLDQLLGAARFRNNLLEYRVCSAGSWKVLASRLIGMRVRRAMSAAASVAAAASDANDDEQRPLPAQPPPPPPPPPAIKLRPPPEGIGLVERTIFVTSPESVPTLDGQTLRQHVDKIVKLNLRTSPVLVLDTRWQAHVGSFRIDQALFPKAKLLFEILHNRGFKIVLTVKPYIDAAVGMASLSQLLDGQRLVVARPAAGPAGALAGAGSDEPLEPHEQATASGGAHSHRELVLRRESLFAFRNQTVSWHSARGRAPLLFACRESREALCALVDLTRAPNRRWLIELIRRSGFLSQEADGILLAGAHPDPNEWEAGGHRDAMGALIDELHHKQNYYVLPKWTGNFNYVQLAPRARDWTSLRSLVDSCLTLGMLGYSLVHPGSVWGDLGPRAAARSDAAPSDRTSAISLTRANATIGPPASETDDENEDQAQRELRAERELVVRWLQVAVFLPVLQFNDLGPIDKHGLHEQLQQLVRLRKLHIVPELKRNLPYTALLSAAVPAPPAAAPNSSEPTVSVTLQHQQQQQPLPPPALAGPAPYQLPALRYTWAAGSAQPASQQQQQPAEALLRREAVGQQFLVGPDVLVAPVLQAGQRQKDIYLPVGIWHDELRQTNIRGGKWLRNYPIELNEIAWFTRARR